jgi:hypothetical protein
MPIIVEDNDLSILTKKSVRRSSWEIVPVARSFGLTAENIDDDPLTIYNKTLEMSGKLPALLNINVCRCRWHAGSGSDGPPKWDRYEMMRKQYESCTNNQGN